MNYFDVNFKLNLSPRMQRVKEAVISRLQPNRKREFTETCPVELNSNLNPMAEVFLKNSESPYVINLANAIVYSWEKTPCVIFDNEIIVGITRPYFKCFEHFSWGIHAENVLEDKSLNLSNEQLNDLRNRMEPLNHDHIDKLGVKFLGEKAFNALCQEEPMFIAGGYQGHTIPNYNTLLDNGLDGVLNIIDKYAKENANNEETRNFYEANRIIIRGMSSYLERYATKAEELAISADKDKKATYLAIAKNCKFVAHNKPETLYQACQLIWCLSLWDWVDCLGRLDQYLYPFYQKAVKEKDVFGVEEIIPSLIFKFWENGAHNVTLGGVHPNDGTDATNELTYLLLQTLRDIHDTHPRMSVRIHENSPAELMQLIVEIWSEGMADPSVVSDKAVIEGLMEAGVPLNDARDYSMLGCQEIEIPGKSNFGCEDGLFNVAKLLEYTMHGGKNPKILDVQVGPKTKTFTEFDSFEEFYSAFETQLKYFVPIFCKMCDAGQEIRAKNFAKLVKTPFTNGCLEKGKPHDLGGPVYNFGVVETGGISAVADSMTAIKKLVFDEKLISKQTLMDALSANFKGFEKERQLLLNGAPKFGNDIDEVDDMAIRVLTTFWDEIRKYKSIRGDVYLGACSLLESGIVLGKWTGALPDGRFAGEPLGNSIGPRPGADKNGLTAMLNSVAKLPLKKGVGGTTLNVLLPTRELSTKAYKEAVAVLMQVYLSKGGQMAQITTANVDELKDAKIHPERYGNLFVRIGGFSIQFVQLSLETQDEVISRYSV